MRFSLILFALLLASAAEPHPARAEVSTDQPGAILVFPKIVRTASRDTIIQISNATGSRVYARCFYVDGSAPASAAAPLWLATDFQITLTQLQPTVWVASEGLPVSPPPDRSEDLYPGPVPPLSVGFLGELRCVVVSQNERPISRNALTGEATLIDTATGAASKYQATAIPALSQNNGDNTLLLNDAEYSSCPRLLLLNHFFDDAPDPILGSPVQSSLTVVPCSMNLETSAPGEATLQFEVYNEFEQRLSASIAIICFQDILLSRIDGKSQPERSIFNFALQGTLVGQTRIRPVVDAGISTGHGVLAIVEEFRNGGQTVSALNPHFIGGNLQGDVIVLSNPF